MHLYSIHLILLLFLFLTWSGIPVKCQKSPSAPLNLTVQSNDPKSIEFTWLPPSSMEGNVTQFKVIYSFNVDGYSETKILLKNDTSVRKFILVNLYPYVTYNIKLFEKIGKFGPPANLTVTTAEGLPQAAVRNFSAVAFNSTSAVLKWLPVLKYLQGGILLSSTIYLTNSGDRQNFQISANHTTKILTNLKANTTYQAYILTSTSLGRGDSLATTTFTTRLSGPSKPLNVTVLEITDTSVRFTWSKPLEPNALVLYHIFLLKRGALVYSKLVTIGNKLDATISELKPSTEYVIEIQGNNKGDPGDVSDPVSFTTKKNGEDDSKDYLVIYTVIPLLIIGIALSVVALILYRRNKSKHGGVVIGMKSSDHVDEKSALTT